MNVRDALRRPAFRGPVLILLVTMLLAACSGIIDPFADVVRTGGTGNPLSPSLPDIPDDPIGAISFLEVILLSDLGPTIDGDTARRMGESTMLFQRLLAADLDLHFDVRIRTEPVLLNPAVLA